MLALGLALLSVAYGFVGVGAAIGARHRAQAAADLAALAAATVRRDGGDACAAASKIAVANDAALASCAVGAYGTVIVTVAVPLPPVLHRWVAGDVHATASAGP